MSIRLLRGKCLDVMPLLEQDSVKLIIADLPYGTTKCHWDTIIPFEPMWEQYARLTTKGCTIVLFAQGLFTARLKLSKPEWFKYDLVWKKSKCGSPFTSKFRPLIKHEDILVFTNDGGKHRVYNPQMLEGKPYSRSGTTLKTNNHKIGLKTIEVNNLGTRHPQSVLDFPQQWRRQDQVHPTQKPVPLMEWLINSYSDKGDLVLDNCMGSGTTAVAAIKLDRNYIGIEMEKEYYDIAKQRVFVELDRKRNSLW